MGAAAGSSAIASRWAKRGFRRTPTLVYVVVALAITLVNVSWVLRDHTAPSWDQSHYLDLTWVYLQALRHHGIVAMIRAVYRTDPGRAPMLSVLLVPFAYLLGPGPGSGLALNLLLWPVLLLSAGALAKEFFNDRARLLTMIVLSSLPTVVWLSHTVLQDFLLCTLATVAVLLVVRTRQFRRWTASVGLGIVLALGTLTKISFLVAIAGPLAVVVVGCITSRSAARKVEGWWRSFRPPVLRITAMAVIAAVPPLLWYVPNWKATDAYLHEAFRIQPGTVADPLTAQHLGQFAVVSLNEDISWVTAGFALLVTLLSLPRFVTWIRGSGDLWPTLNTTALLGSWLVIPVAAVAASSNQAARYAIAAFPAFAVVVAGLASQVTWPRVRSVVAAVAVMIAVTQTLQINVARYRLPLLPVNTTFSTPYGLGDIQLADGDGSAGPPVSRNFTTSVIDYIESRSRMPDGRVEPRKIAVLELQTNMNGNNLPYYAAVRNDPFTFVTLFNDLPPDKLAVELMTYDFALYIAQPPVALDNRYGRVSQLNATAAAREMSPAMFALFLSNPRRIYVGPDSGQSEYVEILERR